MIKSPWEIVSTARPEIVYVQGGRKVCIAGKIVSVAGVLWIDIPDSAKYCGGLVCKSGVTVDDFQWIESPLAIPNVKTAFPPLSASSLISVQPMNLPSGLMFYIDWAKSSSLKP
jgi:hypothetical protein